MEDRLQKVLAHAGVASRRKCEELILEGRVTVDGVVVRELGVKANPEKQVITVDGKRVQAERQVALILNKPTSYVTTVSDPEGRRTVMDLIPDVQTRVYPIGRLDYDTSGLLVFTNDGELTNQLLHPSRHVDKVYRATVIGMLEKSTIALLRDGVELEDGRTSPAKVTVLRNHPQESVLEITIHEGRNRQIRRMMEAVGHPLKRLKRIQFGELELGTLATGKWRWLTKEEWEDLYQAAGIPAPEYSLGTPETKHGSPAKRNFRTNDGARGQRRRTSMRENQTHKSRS